MKILPPRTQPPREPLRRRHRPRAASHWSAFRDCLRWDFGFTCPYCLLHEADLYGGRPGSGLGGMTVEHRVPRALDPARATDYDNCLLACRLCNRARGAAPIEDGERRLLDPTTDAWGAHFRVFADRLVPLAPGGDAEHTQRTYDLDDPRKTTRRQLRRLLIADRLRLFDRLGAELVELLRLAGQLRDRDRRAFFEAIREIRRLRADALRAVRDLRLFSAIPADPPDDCRCLEAAARELPAPLAEQLLDFRFLGAE